MNCKIVNLVFFIIALAIALIIGIMAVHSLPFAQNSTMTGAQKLLMSTSVLFQTMFPVLGVAAFIKFLSCCATKRCD